MVPTLGVEFHGCCAIDGERLKILFLALDVDLSASSGDAIHVRSVAKAFHDLGHQVLLLVGNGQPDSFPHGISVRVQRKKFRGALRVVDDLLAVSFGCLWLGWRSERIVYERRFSCKVGLAIKMLTGSPLGVEINGLIDDESSAQGQRFRLARAWSLRCADKVIAVAPGLATALHQRYRVDASKIHVVSNGVDAELFYPYSQLAARNELGFSPSEKIILFAGNFIDWYDFSLLLESFKIVNSAYPDSRLLLVGEGRCRSLIEKNILSLQLSNSVTLTGRVAHGIIPKFIAASDVCVAPFTRERNENIDLSPIKLFEYLAGGRSVVATDIGGLDRYVVEIPSLHLVEIENIQAFAEKVMSLLSHPEDCQLLVCSKFVRERYSWRQAATQILEHMK